MKLDIFNNPSGKVRVTPFYANNRNEGICTLLELGNDIKLLLDCGFDWNQPISEDILQILPYIDAILLSHADIDHLGALPILLGKVGLPFRTISHETIANIPILCTLPVLKFGQMVLYDYYLNKSMEGKNMENENISELLFDLDDIDDCCQHAFTVKYNQQVNLSQIVKSNHGLNTYFTALSSGRTIGGTMWHIRYGQTDIVYAMDIHLGKETVLDGAVIDLIPTSLPIMIIESGYGNQSVLTRKDRQDEVSKVIATTMKTLREGGNVIIPCESVSRILEWLQLFAKHWISNKLGLYHLVYLSHMSRNILEYARSQLEWMSNSLSEPFYNGKPNPFDLPPVRVFTNIKDMEKKCNGPKVIFCTDSSLSFGLSKELLLRYGGDPRNKLIFIDEAYESSLCADIVQQMKTPPIIVDITRPQRVELVGVELIQYQQNKEKELRDKERILQRKILEREFALVRIDFFYYY